jgi:dimethylaniline monooxygenase (N-oxide forming)
MRTVAIIGAGPAGLVAARYLVAHGLEPVLFEQGDSIGGQWTGDPRYSGVWPSMHTNTSRVTTAFSDLPHARGTPIYPSNQELRAYLQRYTERFELGPRIRLKTRVEELRQDGKRGWTVRFSDSGEASEIASYENVIVASGPHSKPSVPELAGLVSFSGALGVCHSFAYRQPEIYRGKRVLVAGCSISSLEIASELAMLGASRVVSCNRRQRYIFSKLLAGVPADHVAFTRFAALAAERLPMQATAQALKELIIRTSGSPEQFGARVPSSDVFEAGITQAQNFLPLVAEGSISVKPWIDRIDGETVHFADGTSDPFDALILGTGYDLNLPFLSGELRQTLALDGKHIDLYKYTFHPDLPGLAFLGLYDLIGPGFPVLELQARWIAYVWAGIRSGPAREEMEAGLAAYRARRTGPHQEPMQDMALRFARAAGVEPDLANWPMLARALLFGPLTAASFRLSGPDSIGGAEERIAQDAASFGAVPTAVLTEEQRAQLRLLTGARNDLSLTQLVAALA